MNQIEAYLVDFLFRTIINPSLTAISELCRGNYKKSFCLNMATRITKRLKIAIRNSNSSYKIVHNKYENKNTFYCLSTNFIELYNKFSIKNYNKIYKS